MKEIIKQIIDFGETSDNNFYVHQVRPFRLNLQYTYGEGIYSPSGVESYGEPVVVSVTYIKDQNILYCNTQVPYGNQKIDLYSNNDIDLNILLSKMKEDNERTLDLVRRAKIPLMFARHLLCKEEYNKLLEKYLK
jgi:hypothetical protein